MNLYSSQKVFLSILRFFYIFFVHFPSTFLGLPRPRFTCSFTTRACFRGHVDVDAIEVREDEHVDENFLDCFKCRERGVDFVMRLM